MSSSETHRAGFVAIVGRPNVGKSTLLNRYVGEHLAIVSAKPQTTRNRILGVVTRPEFQVAFLDTPGIHQAKGELNRFMVDVALQAMTEVDAVLYLVEAVTTRDGRVDIGEGNKFILKKLGDAKKPVVLGINKIDLLPDKRRLLPIIDAYRTQFPFAEIFPLSAGKGEGVENLLERLAAMMPEGPNLFPEDVITDQAERSIVAEYVREQILKNLRQEIPYSTAVVVEAFDESERGEGGTRSNPKGLVRIDAVVFVERESQKAIVIGKGGSMLKKIGTEARKRIEAFLGSRVFIQLTVRVEPHWSDSAGALARLGYTR
ncbi:MAG: GTPase Era [Deltaproteobacteria bacterium]|nr:GTPase Era [Deltaproteobacteria bacterium]